MNGVTTIPAGKSVIFIESAAPETDIPAFKTFWGSSLNNVSVGSYTGSGIGLGSTGDGVVIFKADGTEVSRVSFGAATAGSSFYWTYKEDGSSADGPLVSVEGTIGNQLTIKSADVLNNLGSPGTANIIPIPTIIRITEAMSSSAVAPSATPDWFELTNLGSTDIDITGWKVDDNSFAFASAVALNGVTTIPAGKSVIFIETATPETTIATFKSVWGSSVDNVSIGSYTGSGIGLGSTGDGVVLFKADGTEVTRVSFGAATAGSSFYWTYDATGTVVASAVISTVGTITGTTANQVTIKSTGDHDTASPGTAVIFPIGAGLNNPTMREWSLIGNTLKFETLPFTKVEIFALTGSKIAVYDAGMEVNLKVNTGAYILKVNNKATKIVLK